MFEGAHRAHYKASLYYETFLRLGADLPSLFSLLQPWSLWTRTSPSSSTAPPWVSPHLRWSGDSTGVTCPASVTRPTLCWSLTTGRMVSWCVPWRWSQTREPTVARLSTAWGHVSRGQQAVVSQVRTRCWWSTLELECVGRDHSTVRRGLVTSVCPATAPEWLTHARVQISTSALCLLPPECFRSSVLSYHPSDLLCRDQFNKILRNISAEPETTSRGWW